MALHDDKRFYLEMEGGMGDNLTVTAYGKRGEIHIRIEEPWAGDTESGFGAICGVTLTSIEAEALAEWIQKRIHATGTDK